MFLVSSRSCLCPIHWGYVLGREWRSSWSSADRRCSNYIWVIKNVIAYLGATNIRDFTVRILEILNSWRKSWRYKFCWTWLWKSKSKSRISLHVFLIHQWIIQMYQLQNLMVVHITSFCNATDSPPEWWGFIGYGFLVKRWHLSI